MAPLEVEVPPVDDGVDMPDMADMPELDAAAVV